MNTLTTAVMTDPYGKVSECIQFTIDDPSDPFVLDDIMTIGQQYTFSLWLMSSVDASLSAAGGIFVTNSSWSKHSVTFTASGTDLLLNFGGTGIYYIYHPKLEIGNKATDWTPAPEDADDRFNTNENAIAENKEAVDSTAGRVSVVEASLQILADSVITRVTDENGNTSTLEQKGTGWTFSLSDLEGTIADALDSIATLSEEQESVLLSVDALKNSVNEHAALTDYVVISEYNGQPCIELGEVSGDFKLRITNTEMYFMAGSMILTTVTNQKMIAEKIEVKQELQQGGFVWMLHGDGNLGLLWKGADS